MPGRFMRVLVFFDLPTKTKSDKRDYILFRMHLIKMGFLMMQESLYSKLVLNGTMQESVERDICKHRPRKGIVQMMSITEKQYSSIKVVTGKVSTDVVNNNERVVIL